MDLAEGLRAALALWIAIEVPVIVGLAVYYLGLAVVLGLLAAWRKLSRKR